jgi:hypothetical protein
MLFGDRRRLLSSMPDILFDIGLVIVLALGDRCVPGSSVIASCGITDGQEGGGCHPPILRAFDC